MEKTVDSLLLICSCVRGGTLLSCTFGLCVFGLACVRSSGAIFSDFDRFFSFNLRSTFEQNPRPLHHLAIRMPLFTASRSRTTTRRMRIRFSCFCRRESSAERRETRTLTINFKIILSFSSHLHCFWTWHISSRVNSPDTLWCIRCYQSYDPPRCK